MSIIADTDVLIDFLRGKDPGASRIETELRQGRLATTVINAFELLSGLRVPKQAAAVESLLGGLSIYVMDLPAARRAAQVRLLLENQGQPIGMADSLIAGICLVQGSVLLTRNVDHFARVPDLSLA